MKIKLILFLILFSISKHSSAQLIKEKIGTSVVVVDGKIVLDSSITYKSSYDKSGRQMDEWKVTRCFDCDKLDTSFTKFDSLSRRYFSYTTQFSSLRTYAYVYFNKSGLDTLMKVISGKDTLIAISRNAIYKKNIVQTDNQDFYYNGIIHHKENRQYKIYSGKKVKKKQSTGKEEIKITSTKCNKENKLVIQKELERSPLKGNIKVVKNKYKYDKKGNLYIFKQIQNGFITIKSFHHYKNNIEYLTIAKYYIHPSFQPIEKDYIVITSYKYNYWD